MGQSNGREQRDEDGYAGASARASLSHNGGLFIPSHSSSGGGGGGGSGNSSAPSKHWPKSFDGGAMEPQGVYTGTQDYHHEIVKGLIMRRRLASFYKGADEEETYATIFDGEVEQTECPICFLNYPSPLNFTRCCEQPICTECFVQIKRADPNHTNPPSSEPAACPYCMQDNFGVVYTAPQALLNGRKLKGSRLHHRHTSSTGGGAGALEGSAIDSSFSIADAAAGASSPTSPSSPAPEEAAAAYRRRKSFNHNDPEVVTVDQIRPDWQAKLTAAHAAIARRANRRIIMRQVGDRLIPVGISSSRLGQELPPGNGPGGAIILQEGQSLVLPPGFEPTGGSAGRRRSGAEGERGSSRRQNDVARYLQSLGSGQDLEDAMMMEAMRQSLLEHEDQQRREADERRRQQASGNATSTGENQPAASQGAGTSPAQVPARAHASSPVAPRRGASASANSQSIAPNASRPAGERVSMIGSSNMVQDLAEMLGGVEVGGESSSASRSRQLSAGQHRNLPPPAPVEVPDPVPSLYNASGSARVPEQLTTSSSSHSAVQQTSRDAQQTPHSSAQQYAPQLSTSAPSTALPSVVSSSPALGTTHAFASSGGASSSADTGASTSSRASPTRASIESLKKKLPKKATAAFMRHSKKESRSSTSSSTSSSASSVHAVAPTPVHASGSEVGTIGPGARANGSSDVTGSGAAAAPPNLLGAGTMKVVAPTDSISSNSTIDADGDGDGDAGYVPLGDGDEEQEEEADGKNSHSLGATTGTMNASASSSSAATSTTTAR